MQQLYHSLCLSPELLPWQLDIPQSRLLLARLDETGYRNTVFLDQRLNRGGALQAVWVPLDQALSDVAAGGLRQKPTCFIFHIGHCGSTLISRLLAHNSALLPIREPLSLRSLASAERQLGQRQSFITAGRWHELLDLLMRLFSRSYSPEQRALVKASSSCSQLTPAVLRTDKRHRAILLYTDIETYLAGVLRPQARDALYAFSQERIVDLQRIAGEHTPSLHELSPGCLGAMNWCASMAEFVRVTADKELHGQAMLVNFEEFLRARAETLQQLFSFLSIATTPGEIRELLDGGDYLRTYSKDSSISYTPELRAEDLDLSLKVHAEEIRQAKRWLTGFVAKVPALASLQSMIGDQPLGG
jgi:hypothetical protein